MGTGNTQQIDVGHWISRIIAIIIDSVILYIVAWLLFSLLLVPILFLGASSLFWIGYGNWLVLPFISGIFGVFYFVILEVYWGGTIGKRIMGLGVQMTNGNKVTLEKAFIRNISKIHPILLLLDWLIAFVTPGDDRRQKYSDRIAGTTVVQASQALIVTSSSSNNSK